jgi:hypothetical protein
MANNNSNSNNVVASNLDDNNYNTDIEMTTNASLSGMSNDYNTVNTDTGAFPRVTAQIIRQANGTANPEKLIMFEGCSMNTNSSDTNENCFMGNKSNLDYQYQTHNEWCNAVGSNLLFNRMNNANAHTVETKPLNVRPLGKSEEDGVVNAVTQPLCEQYNCSRGKQCSPVCKQLNCMNCHC